MPYFGGSILPSSDASTLVAQQHGDNVLQVKPIAELETYGLFYTFKRTPHESDRGNEPDTYTNLVATHPNGYSCKNLADRLLQVWRGEREADYALAQFDYILACGGMAQQRERFVYTLANP